MRRTALLSLLILSTLMACKSNVINRVDPASTSDLSGQWNDTDARLVSEEMITDALTKPWLVQHNRNEQKPPVVIVGYVRNETQEHIDTEVITKELERAFVNSGTVSVVASQQERADIRQEREEQQVYASEETTKQMAQELGADYMMIGNISSIVDEAPNRKDLTIFYTVNLEMVNVETNQKVWIGNKKIKKTVRRRNYRG